MHWYVDVLKNYAGFSGRARRKEYWMFALVNVIITFILAAVDAILDQNYILIGIYSLAILLPSIAVTARRLHDIGKSAGWILIVLIPFVGDIILFVFTCLDSQNGENQYGPNPKASTALFS